MSPYWLRCRKWCVLLAGGGLTLGWLQGFQLIDWASFWTTLLSTWLSTLVSLLFGGNLSSVTT